MLAVNNSNDFCDHSLENLEKRISEIKSGKAHLEEHELIEDDNDE